MHEVRRVHAISYPLPKQRITIRPLRPRTPVPPELKSVRLGELSHAGYDRLVRWLLNNVGPGNWGDYEFMTDTDRWHMGSQLGYDTVWFVRPQDHAMFLLA